MFSPIAAFNGFSVDTIRQVLPFYEETLGLRVEQQGEGLRIFLPGGGSAYAYPKPDHRPADYTMLDFVVEDIDEAVGELAKRGVTFEHYFDWQDDKQIARGLSQNRGPDIAWFKDPAGNIIAVLQDR